MKYAITRQLYRPFSKGVMICITPTYFRVEQNSFQGPNVQQNWHFEKGGQAVYEIDRQSTMIIINISHVSHLQSLSSRLPKMRFFAFFKKMSAAFAPVRKLLSVFPDRIFPQKISTKI